MGFKKVVKGFDVYQKLPSDLTEPTFSGAIISIVSTIIMVILFISEFSAFLEVTETSEMYVDSSRSEQKLQVNVDMVYTRLPCDILSVDAQDVMGSHHVNLEGDLQKYRVNSDGRVIEKIDFIKDKAHHEHAGHAHDQSEQLDMERVKQAFKDNEGCQIKGYIKVNKVPGNFHISAHAFGNVIGRIFQQAGINTLDVSHKINHLSFGKDQDIRIIKKKFSSGVLSPLDNSQKIKDMTLKNQGVMHQYYISIVPTEFVDLRGRNYPVYQFTANMNELQTHHIPAVYFRYDLSPVTVKFRQHRESFLHFLVQVCAIIGGVFTIAGIFDSVVHKSIQAIAKKHEIGKLT